MNGVKLMLSLTINECVEDADGLTGIWLSGQVLGLNTMNGVTKPMSPQKPFRHTWIPVYLSLPDVAVGVVKWTPH